MYLRQPFLLTSVGGGVILKVVVKKGIISLLLLGIVAVLLLLGIFIFGPWELPGFGQLSQRQEGQESLAASGDKQPPCNGYGDVTDDGWVRVTDVQNDLTVDDAELVLAYVVELSQLNPAQIERADVDNDGQVTSVDAMLITQYATGIIDTFDVCKSYVYSKSPPCGSYGDIAPKRGDGKISVTDVSGDYDKIDDAERVLASVTKIIRLTGDEKKLADVDRDKDVDSVDALKIYQYAKGLINTFPVCTRTTSP